MQCILICIIFIHSLSQNKYKLETFNYSWINASNKCIHFGQKLKTALTIGLYDNLVVLLFNCQGELVE